MILHCSACHHEVQSIVSQKDCDWCGGKMYVIATDYMEEPFELSQIRKELNDGEVEREDSSNAT